MENTSMRIKRVLLLLSVLIFIYFLCRILFIVVNRDELDTGSFNNLLQVLAGGLRFDLSAILLTNSLFIILSLLPAPVALNRIYQKTVMLLYLVVNGLCLLPNVADIAYFRYSHKRSQSDTLLFITGEKGNDFARLLPSFLTEFWYLLAVYCFFIYLLWAGYRFFRKPVRVVAATGKEYAFSGAVLLVAAAMSVIVIRGGLQEQPLNLIHASEMTGVKNIPAVLNTPFSIIWSYRKRFLTEKKYLPDQYLPDGIHDHKPGKPFSGKNVVVIILESMSRKYTGYFGGAAHTPFLDSIFSRGYVFTNAFANAYESVQGIPAILSSIPSWQYDPFIFSPYISNRFTSLPGLLKDRGYQTLFFHGGYNGTMGFDSYSRLAGIDHYYGMDEYNNKNDYDGHWGIWDDPFLQFSARITAGVKEPFFAGIFTLNTHHPFLVPAQYRNKFNKHRLDFLNCVEYLDWSLQRYFDSIRKQPWFNNTIFVITADHTAPYMEGEKTDYVDKFRIPVVFYSPGDTLLKGSSNIIANQVDIMPSVLDLLNYPQPYFAMGTSLFSQGGKRHSISFSDNIFQYIDSAGCYQFNGEKALAFYDRNRDSLLQNNLYNGTMTPAVLSADSTLRKMLQFFNRAMIHDRMNVETIRIEQQK